MEVRVPGSRERNANATPARSRSALSRSQTPARPRSSPRARHCRGRHLPRRAFRIQIARPGGPLRLDRCRSFLCPQWLPDRRPIARPARTRTIDQAWALLRTTRLADHAGLLRGPRDLFFVAVVARIFRNVTAALEISFVGAKHRASWRDRVLARLVSRGRGSI